MNKVVHTVTNRIIERSKPFRTLYLERIEQAKKLGPHRHALGCGNLAHGFAACHAAEKKDLREKAKVNIAIVSAYNDMLSAHQPYESYPQHIKEVIAHAGGIAQFAGGVPAMCDGITQGQPGMELSLLSRDVIAMATAVSLSHNMFDGGLMLGICDKIVPGLLIAALSFGHLPFVFVPAGPMPSGLSNLDKARIRQKFAKGEVDKEALLDAESASYHSPGTCTFYGTANSNQLLVEIMGLHLPGASFVNPNTPLRKALTEASAQRVLELTHLSDHYLPIGKLFDAKSLVNGIVGLLATGGSTNHTMHLVAIARAAGFIVNWDDFAELSKVTPLITRIYPNGYADINHFQRAGGMAFLIHTLLEAGLLHEDVNTVAGFGLQRYTEEPQLLEGKLSWVAGPTFSKDKEVLTSAKAPFNPQGGLSVLSGNLGRAVLKTSSLPEGKGIVRAPAVVFFSQDAVEKAFKAGELNKDCVIVLSYQGPKACGMPELHKLTPLLGILQDRGHQVALVTDGRMSGASGKIPAAIHLTPEAAEGGLIGKVQTGDLIAIDPFKGVLNLEVSKAELDARQLATASLTHHYSGFGRELFGALRKELSGAEQGACSLYVSEAQGYE
ncbi:phosphogluconate dehydratase [Legionella impletisoli]|uniref:Phosphogluconate dehydratase n=1 Tax=Legionella impletisoli TaxID=343510 RepID=A0A917JPD0_9GAMM|nr:phosphogluconate dehydratase [Legionella impletisoli]GGI75457.1 phosphogluconate dehydratase [Legionella impletisoli]